MLLGVILHSILHSIKKTNQLINRRSSDYFSTIYALQLCYICSQLFSVANIDQHKRYQYIQFLKFMKAILIHFLPSKYRLLAVCQPFKGIFLLRNNQTDRKQYVVKIPRNKYLQFSLPFKLIAKIDAQNLSIKSEQSLQPFIITKIGVLKNNFNQRVNFKQHSHYQKPRNIRLCRTSFHLNLLNSPSESRENHKNLIFKKILTNDHPTPDFFPPFVKF